MAGAASSTHFRLEGQLTEALAWLLSRSPALALDAAWLYLKQDSEALTILENNPLVGVSTQVRLPPLGNGSHLRPDLSIAVGDRELQLLVEAKVEADFSTRDGVERPLSQPSAYIEAWTDARLDPGREAGVRRVGTLTLTGDAPASEHCWRAADRRWQDVARLIAGAIETSRMPGELIAAADDLRGFIVDWLGEPNVADGLLDAGGELTRALAIELAKVVPGAQVTGSFSPNHPNHFAGGYLAFDAPDGGREKLWLVLTAAGGSYNRRAGPTTLWLAESNEQRLSLPTADRLERVGFETVRDRAGYQLLRVGLDIEETALIADPAGSVVPAQQWASDLLLEAGIIVASR